MKVTLHIWRQSRPSTAAAAGDGRMVRYQLDQVSPDMSFLEMLDVLNEQLLQRGEDPVAFDHDCREGICGACGLMINGVAHGPNRGTATCQLHMRSFGDGDEIYVEPWRARAFPVIKDLVVNRSALDRIIAAGGYISAPTGSAVDGNTTLIPKEAVDTAMDAAQCIGCGACVAACPNGSASLLRPPRSPTSASCRRASPSGCRARAAWSSRWTRRGSAAAPCTGSARKPARS